MWPRYALGLDTCYVDKNLDGSRKLIQRQCLSKKFVKRFQWLDEPKFAGWISDPLSMFCCKGAPSKQVGWCHAARGRSSNPSRYVEHLF